MLKKENSPFSPIAFRNEIYTVFRRAAENRVEFYCKSETQDLFGFKCESFDEDWGLFGQYLIFDDAGIPSPADQVVVNFSVGTDRYYTICEFRPLGSNAVLRCVGPLYKLERRGHLRVHFSPDLNRSCNIIRHQQTTVFISAEIADISQGGLRLQLQKDQKLPQISVGDRLHMVLHLLNRPSLEISASIRHVKTNEDHVFCGMQFVEVSEKTRRQLVAVVLDVQRVSFQKGA